MAVNLTKGQKVSLQKGNEGLSKLLIGLGWDQAKSKKKSLFGGLKAEAQIDCDGSVLMLQDDKLKNQDDIIYFGNLRHSTQSIIHNGDNLTGAGDGDDEQIMLSLNDIPAAYNRIVFVVNIYQAQQRKQHFGMIQNAFIRIVDARNNTEMYRYNLTEDYTNMTAMIFGEIYRNNGEWKFNAIGQGTNDAGLNELVKRYA
ncbi:stress protein [Candidatus Epulonipiscium fishelsonii]|uniref:Stress protein n=1 Tax=Candidatus Epulonipiscium fishelsonii TaxID=77094 RepID=A0ACC8X8Z1_9FIRM|nr:stress protein [Epulopiscium sp. SCG-B11WGA-EpuloA1]ONI39016.1 stress protein [Epulopiscium sp. SCG-B05WGA-EpuloA1]